MRSEKPAQRLLDIVANCDLARQFVGTRTAEALAADLQALYATVRALEIVAEASRKLPADIKARHAEIPWEKIAAAGNVYRHGYDVIDPGQVWLTVTRSLPPVRDAAATALRRLGVPAPGSDER